MYGIRDLRVQRQRDYTGNQEGLRVQGGQVYKEQDQRENTGEFGGMVKELHNLLLRLLVPYKDLVRMSGIYQA